MGRAYAGVLGPLAFAIVLARGVLAESGLESTLATACVALFGFAALGWIAGLLAERFVEESVRSRFQAMLQSASGQQKKRQATAT